MSLRRMKRNARRAVNYNLPVQLPDAIGVDTRPDLIDLFKKVEASNIPVPAEAFDGDFDIEIVTEDSDGNEA